MGQTGTEALALAAGGATGFVKADDDQQRIRDRIRERDDQAAALGEQQINQTLSEIARLTRRLNSEQVQEFLFALQQQEASVFQTQNGPQIYYPPRPVALPASAAANLQWPPVLPLLTRERIRGEEVPIRQSEGQVFALFSRLLLPEFGALILGAQQAAPPTAAQLQGIYLGMSALVAGWTAQGAAAVTANFWNASLSPALADSALDAPWTYTYASNLGTPAIQNSTNGGIVTNSATLASTYFHFINDQNETQTARAFVIQCTNISSAAAGTLFTAYLPKALLLGRSPKAHLQVSRATNTQAGLPYVSSIVGGATPYIVVAAAAAGTNSQVFDISVFCTE